MLLEALSFMCSESANESIRKDPKGPTDAFFLALGDMISIANGPSAHEGS